MKTTFIAFTVLSVLAATTASAQDGTAATTTTMTVVEGPQSAKTFGVGYGETPGGVRGLELEYYFGNLMLDAHFGFLFFSPDADGADSSSAFALAAGLFYRWKQWDNVALMIGGRFDIGHVSGTDDSTQFNFEVPLRAQLYFAEILAVHAEVGPVLAFLGDGGGVLDNWGGRPKGTYLDLPAVNVLATIGVTLYFR